MDGHRQDDDVGVADDLLRRDGARARGKDVDGERDVVGRPRARHGDIIVLAVPVHRFRELPRELFAGKILVDAMNYWEPVDGDDPELTAAKNGTSMIVQERFPAARVVKSLNQLGYHELDEYPRALTSNDRIAIAAAGNDELAVRVAMRLIDDLGFDPVHAGPLANGQLLEPDGSPFAATYTADELSRLVSR